MVTIEQIQAAYYMVAATGVLVAAVYYVLNMRQTIQNRKAQLFTQLTQQQIQKEWVQDALELMSQQWKDLDDFARRYDSAVNPENYAKRTVMFNYLEQLGFYVKKGQIDIEQLCSITGGYGTIWFWDKYGPIIKAYREILRMPHYCENFEYLANAVTDYNARSGREIHIRPQIYGGYKPDEGRSQAP